MSEHGPIQKDFVNKLIASHVEITKDEHQYKIHFTTEIPIPNLTGEIKIINESHDIIIKNNVDNGFIIEFYLNNNLVL